MANDDNKDKEQDDFFGDDDDFGLPELDYEALDDEDSDDAPVEEPVMEDSSEDLELADFEDSSEEDGSFEDSDDTDDFGDFGDLDDDDSVFDSDALEGMDDISEDDIPDMISDEELEASFGDDDFLDVDEMDSEMTDATAEESTPDTFEDDTNAEFYEEESFDDFESSGNANEEGSDSVFNSDVLDDDEFGQFEQEMMGSSDGSGAGSSAYQNEYADSDEGGSKSKFTRVWVIGILVFASLGTAFWYFGLYKSDDAKEPVVAEKIEEAATQPEVKEEEPEATSEDEVQEESQANEVEPVAEEPKRQAAPSAKKAKTNATKPPVKSRSVESNNPGTVNTLNAKTGNYFIIIGSFVDSDMAMDFATELSNVGKSPSVIPPFGKAITHRVAISGYGSLAEAQRSIDGFKDDFGQDVWILRY